MATLTPTDHEDELDSDDDVFEINNAPKSAGAADAAGARSVGGAGNQVVGRPRERGRGGGGSARGGGEESTREGAGDECGRVANLVLGLLKVRSLSCLFFLQK